MKTKLLTICIFYILPHAVLYYATPYLLLTVGVEIGAIFIIYLLKNHITMRSSVEYAVPEELGEEMEAVDDTTEVWLVEEKRKLALPQYAEKFKKFPLMKHGIQFLDKETKDIYHYNSRIDNWECSRTGFVIERWAEARQNHLQQQAEAKMKQRFEPTQSFETVDSVD